MSHRRREAETQSEKDLEHVCTKGGVAFHVYIKYFFLQRIIHINMGEYVDRYAFMCALVMCTLVIGIRRESITHTTVLAEPRRCKGYI